MLFRSVREDGLEDEVFSLIGPKRYDAPWKDLEAQGWIAPAECIEVRVSMGSAERLDYATAEQNEKYRFASTSATKFPVIRALADRHQGERVLVIGQYLEQLAALGEKLAAPVVTGATPVSERERLFQEFREGTLTQIGRAHV